LVQVTFHEQITEFGITRCSCVEILEIIQFI
jgi:hypothetical protein